MRKIDQELVGVIIDIFEDYIDERIEKGQPEIQTPGVHFAGKDYDKLADSISETLSAWEKETGRSKEIIGASRVLEEMVLNHVSPYIGIPCQSRAEEMILQAVEAYEAKSYRDGDEMYDFFSKWFMSYPTALDFLRNEKKRSGISPDVRAVSAVEKRTREFLWDPVSDVLPDGWDKETIAVFGNPDRDPFYTGKFEKLIDLFESMDDSNFSMEVIRNRLSPLEDIPLADSMENTWKKLVIEYHGTGRQQDDAICSAMMLITGTEWTSIEIHGACQIEWNRLYYVENSLSTDMIREIETVYFNTEDWWTVTDEDGKQYDVYTTAWSPKERAEQILYKTDRSAKAVIMKTVGGTESVFV